MGGCSQLSPTAQTDKGKHTVVTVCDDGMKRDCAANSLYALCRKAKIRVSHQECLKLLPLTDKGNSMLEFKNVLRSLGFQVEAQRLDVEEFADLRVPAIVLILPPYGAEANAGHYLVLWPLDGQTVQILDYPHHSVTISVDYWIRHLRRIGIENVPVLLCG
jgi:ABC-type bacteriocin/lantibiotic exporter with double-glycine peptidase domain